MARMTFTGEQVLALATFLATPTAVAYCAGYPDPASDHLAKVRDIVELRADDILNEQRAHRRLRLVEPGDAR